MTKKKLKVMKIVRAQIETETKAECKGKPGPEPKNGEMLEKALQALRDLGARQRHLH